MPITSEESVPSEDEGIDVDNAEQTPSKRIGKQKNFGDDFVIYNIEEDPQTFKEAIESRDSLLWKEAIEDEMDSLLQNHTWELTDLPEGAKPISCKWIFKRKFCPDGTIERYKARLVAKGFSQKEGIDFFDIYAPVCRISTIRVLIAWAAIKWLVIHQMDVKTNFLNGDLTEEIYIEKPEGLDALAN